MTAPLTTIQKTFRYEVYRDSVYLGEFKDVKTEFQYTQALNTYGVALEMTIALDADVPWEDFIGDAHDRIKVRNGNRIKVWETSIYYPNGLLVFNGQINRWEADYQEGLVDITVLSDGLDLDNYIVQGEDETPDVSQTSQNANYSLQNGATFKAAGQTWLTGVSAGILSGIILKLNSQGAQATITVSVYNAANAALLGSASRTINNNSAQDFLFTFSPVVNVTPNTNYFFGVTVDSGQSCLIYYNDTSVYANGDMYVKTSSAGSYVITPADGISAASDLYFKTYYTGESTEFTYSSTDPSNMVLNLMDRYVSSGGLITASGETVALSGVSATYRFKVNTAAEAIDKARELAGSGWYSFAHPGDNRLYFNELSTTPSHILQKSVHIENLKLSADIQSIMNNLYFSGGDTGGGVNLFRTYSNVNSISAYRTRIGRRSDNRVTQATTADLIGQNDVDNNQAQRYETIVTIVDLTCDIRLFRLGQTVGFAGFNTFVDNLVLQIVGIKPMANRVDLHLGSLPPRNTALVEQIRRDLEALQTIDNPASPS